MIQDIEKKAYEEKKVEKPMWEREEATLSKETLTTSANKHQKVPAELQCRHCHELVIDAVMMPCCAEGPVCDECARNSLIESEHNACFLCGDKDCGPEELIPFRKVQTQPAHTLSHLMGKTIGKSVEFSIKCACSHLTDFL